MAADSEAPLVPTPESAPTEAPAAPENLKAAPAVEAATAAATDSFATPSAKPAAGRGSGKRGRKPAVVEAIKAEAPAASEAPTVNEAPVGPAPDQPAKAKRMPRQARAPKAVRIKPAAAEPVAAKPVRIKAAKIKAAKINSATPAPVKAGRTAITRAAAPAVAPSRTTKPKLLTPKSLKPTAHQAAPSYRSLPQSKDTTMVDQTFDFTTAFQTAFSDLQGKAKTAYEKGTVAFSEANEFAKGNVEAIVESGKILASGLQELGSTAVADSRSAFEGLTSDVKTLAAVKSPTEFFQIQSALLRKHFDSVVAQTSKSTEAMLKLANDSIAPLSNRVTLAVEKASKVA